jgi:hypothetical protein
MISRLREEVLVGRRPLVFLRAFSKNELKRVVDELVDGEILAEVSSNTKQRAVAVKALYINMV